MGLGYALVRRLVLRPAYLTDGRDARRILFFIAVIIVTFHLLNAFLMQPSIGGAGFDYRRVFTVSKALAEILGLQNLSPAAGRAAYEAVYWTHILVILGFLMYIPGSKHLHMLAAIPNVFLKPLERPKPMFKTTSSLKGRRRTAWARCRT